MAKSLVIFAFTVLPFLVFAQDDRFVHSTAVKTFKPAEFRGDTCYVTAYGILDLIEGDSSKKVPFYRFNDSGNNNGFCWVNVTNTHKPIAFRLEDAYGWTDTYQDTFSLKELYVFLYQKTKEFTRVSFKDGASRMVIVDIEQYISAQKVTGGILLKWWTQSASVQTLVTPEGNLTGIKLVNAPKNFTAEGLAWIVANSTFGIW
ncbi:MAG: hypothetical protein AAB438_01730 [Patescibacteria group bacterium]